MGIVEMASSVIGHDSLKAIPKAIHKLIDLHIAD